MKDQKGFTLVESLVAAALFAIAVLGMITMMERQNAARVGLQTQINLRVILNAAMQVWAANPGNFPAAAYVPGGGAASRPLWYVGCFQTTGIPTANSIANSEFVSVDLGPAGAVDPFTTVSGICDCANGAINYQANAEVHVVRTIGGVGAANTIDFYAFLLPPLSPGVNPCPTPATYKIGVGATRNWNNQTYVNTPVKQLHDSIDITTPP